MFKTKKRMFQAYALRAMPLFGILIIEKLEIVWYLVLGNWCFPKVIFQKVLRGRRRGAGI